MEETTLAGGVGWLSSVLFFFFFCAAAVVASARLTPTKRHTRKVRSIHLLRLAALFCLFMLDALLRNFLRPDSPSEMRSANLCSVLDRFEDSAVRPAPWNPCALFIPFITRTRKKEHPG